MDRGRPGGHHASVSIIVRFFVAPSHAAAAAVVDGGPDGAFESSAYGNFDAEEALVEWDSLFTGRGLDELVAADEPEFVAGPEGGEGPVVFAASRALQAALAAADRIRLLEVSRRWVRQRAADGESFDPTIATGILSDLVELVRGADGPDHRLYCWMA
ncbi:hypothetical protein STVIR_0734 [Streptomyces viridochromogenes Tue57]|uniref:Uncharacterized protein n=1 Tax=Streptomyces viridochromogenes Tue57 TaxID=1160705 RepID=L8PP71_STRVR|nr:hypothetical protein STVIR_0734 [Streptomyces viridochromogenes Tue57]